MGLSRSTSEAVKPIRDIYFIIFFKVRNAGEYNVYHGRENISGHVSLKHSV